MLYKLEIPSFKEIFKWSEGIAEGLPIRYIYQGQHFFLEDPVIAERIIGDVIESAKEFFPSKTLKDVLDTLPDGFYSFGIEKTSFEDGFKYSPLSIRLSLFTNDDKIIEKANIKKNKDSIRDWLIKYRAALAEHAASSSSLP